ncbi:MAG: hypothetical protein NZT92_09265, partial [Abditibacteriales bacterium]|nr:hypothetical protein [Abditibacteriales bacterium]MDW8366184.1 hypothetical protein [Abditibacteriales bacterium]
MLSFISSSTIRIRFITVNSPAERTTRQMLSDMALLGVIVTQFAREGKKGAYVVEVWRCAEVVGPFSVCHSTYNGNLSHNV